MKEEILNFLKQKKMKFTVAKAKDFIIFLESVSSKDLREVEHNEDFAEIFWEDTLLATRENVSLLPNPLLFSEAPESVITKLIITLTNLKKDKAYKYYDKIAPESFREIEKRINLHHQLYPRVAVKDVYWENVLEESLKLDPRVKIKGRAANSHEVGVDVTYSVEGVVDDYKISCKSGKIDFSRNELDFSSSRTTSYPTLEEKIEYISAHNEDLILFLASQCSGNEKTWNYRIYALPSELLDFKKLTWTSKETGRFVNHHGEGEFSAKIVASMSDQLWCTLPLKMLHLVREFNVYL